MHRIAVYGSLKKGFGNHRLLETSKLLETGVTVQTFTMVSFGGFPGIFRGDKRLPVAVEVYEVSDEVFERLERLEGAPSFYHREPVEVSTVTGIIPAEIYVLTREENKDPIAPIDHVYNWSKEHTWHRYDSNN